MAYYGSWKFDDLLTFVVTTSNPSNGMAQNADAVPTYHVYEDETPTPIITGSMALLNNPATIGFYSEQISLSSVNGFEKGKSYNIYIRAVVNNVTGSMSHNFQMEAEVDANTVSTPVTAGNVTGSVLGNVNGSVNSVVTPVGISTGSFINAIADQVWDETLAQHLSAGSTGNALNSAGAAGDPWSTSLPGIYTAGQAGHILASRMPTGTVVVGSNQDKTGYSLSSPQSFHLIGNISGTHVGNLQGDVTGSVGSLSDIATALGNKIADFVLRRSFASARASSNGDAVSFRSLLGAVAKLVNRWAISGATLTIYAEDDATPLGTQTLTSDATADPITQINTD